MRMITHRKCVSCGSTKNVYSYMFLSGDQEIIQDICSVKQYLSLFSEKRKAHKQSSKPFNKYARIWTP